jgi:DNA-binding response OmpR family regulator
MAQTIIIINESVALRQFVSAVLNGAGYDTIEANDVDAARLKIRGKKIRFIVGDAPFPEFNGIEQVSIKSLFARRICHG